ncbi:MAG: reverse transcriptase family protein [Chitinophagales bacterium]|nr:reverse transcriptase family protein [Chitinophagales bacterium]
MPTVEKILTFSQAHKSIIQKYFHGGYYYSNTPKLIQEIKKHELNALFLLSIETPTELCRFLKTSFFELEEQINDPIYKHYAIKKKRGGNRQIYSPENKLKAIQRRLNYFLQAYYLWIKPNEVFGFVVNPHYLGNYCNIAENAKPHIGKKHLLNIDLKDFFPSISASRVKSVFTSSYFNFSEQIATALTLLTTYEGHIPIGAPTSPVISNFVCFQLDADLKSFCDTNGLRFTRYADDLTFSSDTLISFDVVLDIINLIRKNGFAINEKKLRLKSSNRKQTVTGLIVNEKVNVDRKLLKKIRAMLHDLTTNGIDIATKGHFNLNGEIEPKHRAKFIQRLEGYINFVGQVRGKSDELYFKQKTLFDSLFESKNKE